MSRKAADFADSVGAKLTLPSVPLSERKDVRTYFTHTDVTQSWKRSEHYRGNYPGPISSANMGPHFAEQEQWEKDNG